MKTAINTVCIAWFLAGMRNLGAEASYMAWLHWCSLRRAMKQ